MSSPIPLNEIDFLRRFHAFCVEKGDGKYDPIEANECALAQFGYPNIAGHLDANRSGIPYIAFKHAVIDVQTDECGCASFADLARLLEDTLANFPEVKPA